MDDDDDDDADAEDNCQKDNNNNTGKAMTKKIVFHPGRRRCELCSSCSRDAAFVKTMFHNLAMVAVMVVASEVVVVVLGYERREISRQSSFLDGRGQVQAWVKLYVARIS